jgi:integrase
VTLAVLFDEWLDTIRPRVTQRTADGYQGLIDRYVRPELGSKRVNQLETRDIQKLYTAMQSEKSLSARIVRHTHAVLRQVLEQAVEWKVILRNPADSLKRKLPKVSEVERRVLNEAEAGAFLKACNQKPHGLIFEFALLSGMRPEEYLALQWRDLNFDRNTAQVRRALVRHKKVWRFQEPKTKGSKRSVTIPASLGRRLVIHKRVQAEQRLKIGNGWQANDLVFCSEFGTPLSIPNLTYRYFRPILERAGLPQIRLYDLRHSHATLLLAADEHLKVVSERLGHSTIRLTADTYSHVLESMQQGTASKLESMLYGT